MSDINSLLSLLGKLIASRFPSPPFKQALARARMPTAGVR